MILERGYSGRQSRLEYPERRTMLRGGEVFHNHPDSRRRRPESKEHAEVVRTRPGEGWLAKVAPEPMSASLSATASGERIEDAVEHFQRASARQLAKGCPVQIEFPGGSENTVGGGVCRVRHEQGAWS